MRVPSAMAARTPSSGNSNPAPSGTSTTRPPAASAHAAYMSKVGTTTMASSGAVADCSRSAASAASEDALVEPVGQQQRVGGRRRAAPAHGCHGGVVVRIARRDPARQRAERLEHRRRAAGRCSRSGAGAGRRRRRDALVFVVTACPLRARRRSCIRSTRACPSALRLRASATRRRRDARAARARVIRWTVETRTKSAALRPPRPRAAPLVGSTWLEPVDVVAATPARCNRRRTPFPRSCSAARDRVAVAHHVLGRDALAERDRLVDRPRDDDRAVARECRAAPDRRPASARAISSRRARASARDGVIRIARASGSCSACASRSAAIQAGRPVRRDTAISLGPAKKSIAQSPRHSALAAAT